MTLNEYVEEHYKAHCEHNGLLQYRTGDSKQYYCSLNAESCPYYKTVKGVSVCNNNKVYEKVNEE